MAVIQLDLFEPPPTENDMIRAEVKETKESIGNVRRGLFSRYDGLCKLYLELEVKLTSINSKLDVLIKEKKS